MSALLFSALLRAGAQFPHCYGRGTLRTTTHRGEEFQQFPPGRILLGKSGVVMVTQVVRGTRPSLALLGGNHGALALALCSRSILHTIQKGRSLRAHHTNRLFIALPCLRRVSDV